MTYNPATDACQCEHIAHETPNEAVHPYLGTPAGDRRAIFVGPVCDDCATGHLADYPYELLVGPRPFPDPHPHQGRNPACPQ